MSKKEQAEIYHILAFQFAGQEKAKEVVREIRATAALEGYKILAQAIVEQDTKGKVHIHETGKGGKGAAAGAVGGGLLSLIGGPVGVLAWAVGGAVVGGVAGKYLGRPISRGELKELGETMRPDTSAFLVLLEDKDSEAVIKSMSGYNANVVRLTIGDELSGQIASYVAGEASDDQGNVIAGAGGVTADSEGNISAAGVMAAGSTTDSE